MFCPPELLILQVPTARRSAPVQYTTILATAWTAAATRGTILGVRTLSHIKKLDDCFGLFLVRVTCMTSKTWRDVDPEALARIAGWSATFEQLAPRMRCSKCGAKDAELVAVAQPRPRGVPRNPH